MIFGVDDSDYYDDYQDTLAEVKRLERELEKLKEDKITTDYIKEFFAALQKDIHLDSRLKGWWDLYENGSAIPKNPLEIYSLIHSEISEAVEEARHGRPALWDNGTIAEGERLPKPEGQMIELADAMIRIMDFAESHGWNMGEAIQLKMRYNKTRPYRHGNKVY